MKLKVFVAAIALLGTTAQAQMTLPVEPGAAIYSGGGFDNPVIGTVVQKMFETAILGSSEFFTTTEFHVVRSVIDIPDLPFLGTTLHVSGRLLACSVEDYSQTPLEVATPQGFTIDDIAAAVEKIQEAFAREEAAANSYKARLEECGVTVTEDGNFCDVKLYRRTVDWNPFSNPVYTVVLSPATCPILGRFTEASLTVELMKSSDTLVEVSEIQQSL